MEETNNQNFNNNIESGTNELTSPDFSKISEKPKKSILKKVIFWALKILAILIIIAVIFATVLGVTYYKNFLLAKDLIFSGKANLELAIHKMVNREFQEAADLIALTNSELAEAQELLNEVVLVRRIPYIGLQLQAVDQVLNAGINLTDSGQRVVLLIHDIIEPLQNESISYASITPAQKKEILDKIVASEDLLYEVKAQIDEAVLAIDAIPEEKLVKPLREGILPLKENLPKVKELIDHSLPMLRVVPQIVGFEQPKSYLFLLQNNSELRPTGGFIGTYGILKLQDGEIIEFETDNIYNLDRAPQYILKEPSPEPIVKYLGQKYWSLRDINWAPDFPTTAQKALYMYDEEYKIWQDLKESGRVVVGEEDIVLTEVIPYQEVDGVIAMTPEVIKSLLRYTGPIVVNGVAFTDENLTDQLEFIVGKEFRETGIPISERKEIIKKLADQIKIKILSLPLHKVTDLLEIAYASLDQKQILIYSKDSELQTLILDRNWGGQIQKTEGDYLMVIDSNLQSLKTDQYVQRYINYSFRRKGNDLIAKVILTYKNNADFTWKSTRLRSYTRIYTPLGSQLVSSSGAMIEDNNMIERIIARKDFPAGVNEEEYIKKLKENKGEVATGEEFDKTYFGAFIAVEPHETGTLVFEYKLPDRIKNMINENNYNLLIQKQPGTIHNLTLDLKFDKTIKSATPGEIRSEWFNDSYNYFTPLNKDINFYITLK